MTREEKSKVIETLTAQLTDNENIYLADISGLDAGSTTNLRRACFKAGIQLSVVKNTLLKKAMESSDKDFGELKNILKGSTSIRCCELGNSPAKVIKEVRRKSDKPVLNGAYILEVIFFGENQLDSFVELRSRYELVGEIAGSLQSPANNV